MICLFLKIHILGIPLLEYVLTVYVTVTSKLFTSRTSGCNLLKEILFTSMSGFKHTHF